jgi:hypothetical protein
MKSRSDITLLFFRNKILGELGFSITKSGLVTLKTVLFICLSYSFFSSIVFASTINNTVWKVNEYPFDYYYGFHKYQFYLRYDDDDWWKWNKGFPFPFGLSLFFDRPTGLSFGLAYGEAIDMYHYQTIRFDNTHNTATSWCYRLIKNPKPGEDSFIHYILTLHKISDNWDGVSPPPD